MPTDEKATIRVRRRADGYRDRGRRYRVILDGQEVDQLHPGESCELDVAAGSHQLEVRVDWAGTGSQDVIVGPGESVEFECRNRPGWSTIIRAFTAPSSYLQLHRTSPSAPS